MTPEQYQRLSAAFDDVVSLSPSERRRVLDDRFSGERELRARIEELLAEHDRNDAPVATARGLEAAEIEHGPRDLGGKEEFPAPALKGAYRLLRKIGEGGMGVVYEAEQDFPRRRVALKSIRPGLATRGMLRRFKNEVDLLARLHHPGIAQIYEAGFADELDASEAFFVMELVEGLPLHKYAREREMSVPDRLRLLLAICEAIQHAHQRGVIHRDLKPGNIIVTATGQPKVLDFGIARAVDEQGGDVNPHDTMHTKPGQVVGTPSYMSPEQLLSEFVDTRTDVYSLGVIAYELLSGSLPFDFSKTPISEATRVIRERRPVPLGERRRSLRGDIETVVAMAMHPDLERRYSSAAALADDLKSLLEGRPIHARQDSTWYVLRKLAGRNKGIVSLGVALVLAVVVFAIIASVMASRNATLAVEATRARDKAQAETAKSNELSRSLEQELSLARIERARAEANAGKLKLAEDILWPEYLAAPRSMLARWALWELYYHVPCRWSVQAEEGLVTSAIARDGSFVVLAYDRTKEGVGQLVLRSGADGSVMRALPPIGARINAVAVMENNTRAAVGLIDGRVAIVDFTGNQPVDFLSNGSIHAGGVRYVTLSGDGAKLFVGGADKRITAWDVRTRTMIDQWQAHDDPIRLITADYRGTRVATSGTGLDEPRYLWTRGASPSRIELPVRGQYLTYFAFLPDDEAIVMGLGDFGDSKPGYNVGWFDLRTSTMSTLVSGLAGAVHRVVASPDNTRLAIGTGQTLTVFDRTNGGRAHTFGQQLAPMYMFGWNGDDRILTLTSAGEIRCFDARPEPALTKLGGFRSWCFASAWSADSKLLAYDAGGSGIAVHDPATMAQVAKVDIAGNIRLRGMQFIGDSTRLVAGGADGILRHVDARTGTLIAEIGTRQAEIYSLKAMPDGRTVLTGHADGMIREWDLDQKKLIRDIAKLERRVECFALSPDGAVLASTGQLAAVQLWNAQTMERLGTLPTSAAPWGVAISPDGRTLLASNYNGTIDVFDMQSRTLRATLTGHQRLVPGIAFSPDGQIFATGSEDSTVRIWDAASLRSLVAFETNSAEIVHLAFDPSSRYLSASAAARTLLVYDLQRMTGYIEGNRAAQEARFKAAIPGS